MKKDSRRGVFAAHVSDPLKVKCCPICQWAIEQDHAEALGMQTGQTTKLSHPTAGLAPESDTHENIADLDFDLVQGVRRLSRTRP